MATTAHISSSPPYPSSRALSFAQLLNLAVGIIGIQFAWSMQIALSSRVLEPLGANPFLYSLIWCAGPVTGLLVQPIIGALSDKTWTPLGRRRPFILLGALLGAIALFLFPYAPTLLIAALLIWVIDACVNVSQGPYRALVPDIVPEHQQTVANSYLNFAFGAGSVISLSIAPILRLFNVEMTVAQQYIMASAALILLILYTSMLIREHARPKAVNAAPAGKVSLSASFRQYWQSNPNIRKLSMVQFFTWLGVMCLFIYLTPFVVHSVYQIPDMSTPAYKRVEALDTFLKPLSGLKPNPTVNIPLLVLPEAAPDSPWLHSILGPETVSQNLPPDHLPRLQAVVQQYRQYHQSVDGYLTAAFAPHYTPTLITQIMALAESDPVVTQLRDRLDPLPESPYRESLAAERQYQLLKRAAEFKSLLFQPSNAWVLSAELNKFQTLKARENEATNTAQVSLVAFNLTCLLLSLPLGYLSSRIGKKRLYTLTLMFMALAFASVPWITTGWQVILMMAFAGVAWATILSIPFAFLCDYLPAGHEASMMGIFNMFVAAPQLISATQVGWMIAQSPLLTPDGATHNWSLAFMVGAVSVVFAVTILQGIDEKRVVVE
jgi:MFS family permease